uniref:DUF2142 domain-containing protein n=1 Tax=Clostridium sp. NkU-1 TaxID=1095009 RepID=UPI000ABA67FA
MKLILNKKGLLLTAGSIFFLAFLFIKTYEETIVGIPSPEFEAVRRFYWWLIVFGCGFLACLGAALWIIKTPTFFLFPGTVVILGLFYMLVLTPFSTPDEAAHFTSAYRLSSQLMGKPAVADDTFLSHATEEEKERISRGANVLVRSGDDVAGLYTSVGRTTYNLVLKEMFSLDKSQGMTVRYEIPVNTTPVVYLPQTLGICLARLLHLGYIPLVYLGRLFNLLAFAGMTALAVRIMPFKKELLMAVSCLPMTLHLAASFSYDAAFIGLSMLFLAWCFYLAFEKEKVTGKDTVLLALLLILLEPGKIVYLPVAGICLFIPSSKFKSKKDYWISVIGVITAVIVAVFLVNRLVLSAWATTTESYVGWSEAAGYTLKDVWEHPYRIFQVYYETLVTQFDYYLTTMLGGFLGNLDPNLTVPPFCLSILWYVLFVSAIRREGEEAPLSGGQKLWMVFLVFLSTCLVLASMLLGWTQGSLPILQAYRDGILFLCFPLCCWCYLTNAW